MRSSRSPAITTPFTFNLIIGLRGRRLLASPVWLYQIWGFITPGLHRRERRWAVIFSVTAGPLFIAGAALAYFVLPVGIKVLLNFTPEGVTNLNDLGAYLQFILRLLLVFGVAFELPVFLVLLNLAGVVTGERLGKWRRAAIFGIFVFGAVATPTGDPITMLLLADPDVVAVRDSGGHLQAPGQAPRAPSPTTTSGPTTSSRRSSSPLRPPSGLDGRRPR